MTHTVNVTACTLRRDDKYLVLFTSKAGPGQAVSDHPVKVGSDVRVRDGRVV